MTRIISNSDIEGEISTREVIDLLEVMFEEMGANRAITNSREDVLTPFSGAQSRFGLDPDVPVYHGLKSMGGVVPAFGLGVIRINSDIIAWPTGDNGPVRKKIPASDGRYTGFVLAFSTETGEPLLLFPDGLLQSYRVAGTSALGVKYLANEDISRVGMLGTGWQARAHALAISDVRSFDDLVVYSPTDSSRNEFVSEMDGRIDATVRAVDTPQAVFEDSDVVQCVTNTTEPVFKTEWIEPGTHLGCIRQFEPPASFWEIDRFDVFAQSWSQITQIEEYVNVNERTIPSKNVNSYVVEGDRPVPKLENREPFPVCDWSQVASLADIIQRGAVQRTDSDDVTVFYNRGMGIQFVPVAKLVLEYCEEHDCGTVLPTEMFTQEYKP